MNIINDHTGEFAALLTAFFWTVTSLAFETASHKIGTIAVNILRLVIGLIFLSIYAYIRRGLILPTDATMDNWIWLTLSGLVGFVFGDLFLFLFQRFPSANFPFPRGLKISLLSPLPQWC